ncbi:DEAD-domain-containing protein [Coemansia reversa NRRL 1564]|uniref:RNA helicase n=1 Tax=Coemansia reversa (strain ATCC 12441 / NRRL 1564) TaxID=763665 RepID=A0A2G5B853_COERN|nr:DEAD-domain-containing protein [Coemansia reversa NRRL 1564]|eukprot:PIA15171.1 DEAD-domain-containing protein [Coemansia reversa NRRL 1564]
MLGGTSRPKASSHSFGLTQFLAPSPCHFPAASASEENDADFDLTTALIPQAGDKAPIKKRTAKMQGSVSTDDVLSSESDTEAIQKSVQAQNRKKKKSGGFQSMGLHPQLFRAVINKGFKVPTPIQRKTIPVIMQGRDVVGMARTGSGKTAAFLIPMVHKLKAHSVKVGARALILSPSRELALQTHRVAKELIKYTDMRAVPIVGGDSLEDQFGIIASNPDIIIATPGRLLHLVVEMNMDLSTVEYVVFDEADRLFELGFAVQLHELLGRLSAGRQTLLFSATLPSTLVDFAKAGLQDPELIRLDVESKISQDLEMAFFSVKQNQKESALIYLLRDVIGAPVNMDKSITSKDWRKLGENSAKDDDKERRKGKGKNGAQSDDDEYDEEDTTGVVFNTKCQTIVFVSTKHHVEYLNALLTEAGFAVSHIYGSLDQTARRIQISRFTTGKSQVLVVTDVAARGIDIPILENVINYDFVDTSKVFVHRVGRTARAGRRGWAYSLVTSEELPYVLDLQLFLGRPLQLGSSVFISNNRTPSYNKSIVLGQFPLDLTAIDKEWVDHTVSGNVAIDNMKRSASNGSKLYIKSKQTAARESYKRSKEIQLAESFAESHILLASRIDASERHRMDMLRNLSGFRPNETVFEIGKRGVKHTTTASLVMQNYRMASGLYIGQTKKKRDEMSDPMARYGESKIAVVDDKSIGTGDKSLDGLLNPTNSGNYRDDDFYIPYTKEDQHTEKGYAMTAGVGSFAEKAQGAIVALNGDENEQLLALQHAKQSKNAMRWDSKKKKFVRGSGIGSDNKKLIRTENGTVLPATFKSGTFKDWQDKNRINVPRVGEQELGNAASKANAGKYTSGRFQHTKVTEAKPLDPLAMDYERKMRKRKMQNADDAGANGDKYKGTVEFSDSEPAKPANGKDKRQRTSKDGKNGKGGKGGRSDNGRKSSNGGMDGNGRKGGSGGKNGNFGMGGRSGTARKFGRQDRQPARTELKSRDQIRKGRILKEQRVAKTGRHTKKGGGGKRR